MGYACPKALLPLGSWGGSWGDGLWLQDVFIHLVYHSNIIFYWKNHPRTVVLNLGSSYSQETWTEQGEGHLWTLDRKKHGFIFTNLQLALLLIMNVGHKP